ncbi:MAG TPA: site-specific integrase, partial [Veillonellaceae bacterium]|nr:site-specific integrase [Veillonellaceae bacterium]
ELGLRQVNFHALRHTFATRCVECHMDIKTLSEILGHSSVQMTLDRYVHSSMNFKRKQLDHMYNVLLPEMNG